jgi:hypothetical protein
MSKFSLNNIIKKHEAPPPLMILHGDPGVGKSHFCVDISGHIMIQTGDKLGTLQPTAFPMAESFNDVMEQMHVLETEDHQYSTLVVDTLTNFDELLNRQAVADWNADGTKNPRSINQITDPDFGAGTLFAMQYWKTFLEKVENLQKVKNMAVILVAHSNEKPKVDPLNPQYRKICVKLSTKAGELLTERADIVAYMKLSTNIVREKKDFGGENVRASSSGMRVLCLDLHPAYEAKNRYGIQGEVNAKWSSLMDAIQKAQAPAEETSAT